MCLFLQNRERKTILLTSLLIYIPIVYHFSYYIMTNNDVNQYIIILFWVSIGISIFKVFDLIKVMYFNQLYANTTLNIKVIYLSSSLNLILLQSIWIAYNFDQQLIGIIFSSVPVCLLSFLDVWIALVPIQVSDEIIFPSTVENNQTNVIPAVSPYQSIQITNFVNLS
jgi:hypothetical protein